ncbi:hypothetical protein ACFYTQ_02420 [Nocardia sp. NPDC004068]|uniref:hypothetical protein n=1 Tax=Nocardia sp. NPDC004068 TaxID=3364303 RepID=UPI0036A61D18
MGTVLTEHLVVDGILPRYADALADDAPVYRNHVLRCLNYQTLLLGHPVSEQAALAWTVHDLGIWTAGTFDYLGPSAALLDELAAEVGIDDPAHAKTLVLQHHSLRPVPDREAETFRRADLVDVSRGVLRAGLPRPAVRAVTEALPYRGFHRWLTRGLLHHALRHPLHPAPMLRW